MEMLTANTSVNFYRAPLEIPWFSCLTCTEGHLFVTSSVPGSIVCARPNQDFIYDFILIPRFF